MIFDVYAPLSIAAVVSVSLVGLSWAMGELPRSRDEHLNERISVQSGTIDSGQG